MFRVVKKMDLKTIRMDIIYPTLTKLEVDWAHLIVVILFGMIVSSFILAIVGCCTKDWMLVNIGIIGAFTAFIGLIAVINLID